MKGAALCRQGSGEGERGSKTKGRSSPYPALRAAASPLCSCEGHPKQKHQPLGPHASLSTGPQSQQTQFWSVGTPLPPPNIWEGPKELAQHSVSGPSPPPPTATPWQASQSWLGRGELGSLLVSGLVVHVLRGQGCVQPRALLTWDIAGKPSVPLPTSMD